MTTISIDTDGNRLYAENGNVYLALIKERCRKIATIDKPNKVVIMEREGKHLLRKADAYGFNYELIKKIPTDYKIRLHTPEGVFMLTPEKILAGSFLWFKNTGFERQIFLTRQTIQKINS